MQEVDIRVLTEQKHLVETELENTKQLLGATQQSLIKKTGDLSDVTKLAEQAVCICLSISHACTSFHPKPWSMYADSRSRKIQDPPSAS
jgi:hypothetical protein